jgi:hypothetical protein
MSEKISRGSRTLQPQSFDHGSEFLASTQAGFARGTDRIRGTGRLYRSWLGFGREGTRMPVKRVASQVGK